MKLMETTEQLNTVQSAENTDKQSYLIEHENVEETPFTMVKNEGIWYGVIGNHRLTEGHNDKEELKKELTEITWNRLVQVIWAINEKFKIIKENE